MQLCMLLKSTKAYWIWEEGKYGVKQYSVLEIPAQTMSSFKWTNNKAGRGAVIGGLAGGLIGAVCGATFSGVFGASGDGEQVRSQALKGMAFGVMVGVGIGVVVGSNGSGKVKFDVNGDTDVWNANRHRLPPAGFRYKGDSIPEGSKD